jgi:hypothetical protein
MNERIKQLAKQAGDYVNEVYTPPVRSKTPGKIWEDGHVDWHTQFNEKFAQLIVRECALLCESRPSPGDDVRSRQHCSEQILEHFGVES